MFTDDSPRIYNILFYGYMLASIVASIYSGDILIKATLNVSTTTFNYKNNKMKVYSFHLLANC